MTNNKSLYPAHEMLRLEFDMIRDGSGDMRKLSGTPTQLMKIIIEFNQLTAKLDAAIRALETSGIALNDWAVSYAPDMCGDEAIKDTTTRIGKHGTLAYIANCQENIRNAFKLINGDGER